MREDPESASAAALPRLILASSSPRRRALLAEAGFQFDVREPTVDESRLDLHWMTAEQWVCALAYYKARSVADGLAEGLVLGADTVVECGGAVLGKPADADHARSMLTRLAGSEQRVLTGLALVDAATGRRVIGYDQTKLKMRPLSAEQIEAYVTGGAGQGKAGAYALQEGGDAFVEWMDGSASNVIGLPMEALECLLGMFLRGEDHELHQLPV